MPSYGPNDKFGKEGINPMCGYTFVGIKYNTLTTNKFLENGI